MLRLSFETQKIKENYAILKIKQPLKLQKSSKFPPGQRKSTSKKHSNPSGRI